MAAQCSSASGPFGARHAGANCRRCADLRARLSKDAISKSWRSTSAIAPIAFAPSSPIIRRQAFTILLGDRATGEAWHVQGLPVAYAVDADGILRLGAIGERDWDAPAIERQFAHAAARQLRGRPTPGPADRSSERGPGAALPNLYYSCLSVLPALAAFRLQRAQALSSDAASEVGEPLPSRNIYNQTNYLCQESKWPDGNWHAVCGP